VGAESPRSTTCGNDEFLHADADGGPAQFSRTDELALLTCSAASDGSDGCERLIQVGEQVPDILQTERQPHRVLSDTRRGELGR